MRPTWGNVRKIVRAVLRNTPHYEPLSQIDASYS